MEGDWTGSRRKRSACGLGSEAAAPRPSRSPAFSTRRFFPGRDIGAHWAWAPGCAARRRIGTRPYDQSAKTQYSSSRQIVFSIAMPIKRAEQETAVENRSEMTQKKKAWLRRTTRPARPNEAEKRAIIGACEAFIRDVLKPRFLMEITPTEWNYVVDICGAWAAGRYRFIQRYRSGMEHNRGAEFDAPFARIDRMGPNNFDIYWMRHTGTWWRLYTGITLVEALRILETDVILHPV